MVSLFLIIFIILLTVIIVEIAATALKMTGLDIHTARFQALSAITGTGFTTRETEAIMKHRQRRNIIMALMILGPICFLGMFSSLLASMRYEFIPVHFLSLLVFLGILFLLMRNVSFVAFFHKTIEKQLKRYRYPRKIQLEEVLQLNQEYGVYELKVTSHSSFAHKQLSEADFKEKGFMVLAIERAGQLVAVPKATDILLPEDVLVIFGHLKGVRTLTGHERPKEKTEEPR